MRIAVFIAWPDVCPFVCGGTIIKHTRRGDEAYIVSVTPGELGHPTMPPEETGRVRTKELQEEAKIEGVKGTRVLNFKDQQIHNTYELRMGIVNVIRELKPDVVLTHYPNDAASDPRNTGEAVIDACVMAYLPAIKTKHPPHMVQKIYTFPMANTSIGFEPDFFVDITDTIDTTIEAAKCHKSMIESAEFGGASVERWTSTVQGTSRYWGTKSKVMYAEAFKEITLPYQGKKALDYLPL